MYATLDRADFILQMKDGGKAILQTDHREIAEIERQPELSTLFALIRVLNGKRMAEPGEPEPPVLYQGEHGLPEFVRQAVRAAGGVILADDGLNVDNRPVEAVPLEDLIPRAFENLARTVAAEYGVAVDRAGVEIVEAALARTVGKAVSAEAERDEALYWSAVLMLGSLAGEVIRAAKGGRWTVTRSGSLPFSFVTEFRGEEATVNPLGKAIKRFANGEEDSVPLLIDLILGDR